MKLPYKGGGVALFYKDKHTGEYSILLGKRTVEPGKGKWSIPGGGYEPQDVSICATAQREFWEETGISLKTVCPASEPDMYRFRLPFFYVGNIFAGSTINGFSCRCHNQRVF